jgi:hypothetical protein
MAIRDCSLSDRRQSNDCKNGAREPVDNGRKIEEVLALRRKAGKKPA